jgi:transcriptional regulator with XRE-family HTH domain
MTQDEWKERNPLLIWRREKGWSRSKLAKLCLVDQQAIYFWETGRRNPRLDNFISICHYTGITAQQWQTWLEERPHEEEAQASATGAGGGAHRDPAEREVPGGSVQR